MTITRRTFVAAVGAAGLAGVVGRAVRGQAAADPKVGAGKRVLFFTRSQDFPHAAVIHGKDGSLGWGEKLLKGWAEAAGYEIEITKDGTVFTPEKIAATDVFVFYTTGDLTQPAGTRFPGSDTTPAMTAEGKTALLKAIAGGKGFVGMHCATDTFHSKVHDKVVRSAEGAEVDPYIAMLGGEFFAHGSQQVSKIHFVDPAFAGMTGVKDFAASEEWYSQVNLAPDLHVIAVQETDSMKTNAAGKREWQYQRASYPETWARRHGEGRVFYTSMGHRQDIWEGEVFQKLIMAGIGWGAGVVKGEATPNFKEACPGLEENAPAGPATRPAAPVSGAGGRK